MRTMDNIWRKPPPPRTSRIAKFGVMSPETRAKILEEYFSGKTSGVIAKKFNCSAGYVRSLAFYHVHNIKPHLVNAYKKGELNVSAS